MAPWLARLRGAARNADLLCRQRSARAGLGSRSPAGRLAGPAGGSDHTAAPPATAVGAADADRRMVDLVRRVDRRRDLAWLDGLTLRLSGRRLAGSSETDDPAYAAGCQAATTTPARTASRVTRTRRVHRGEVGP